MFNKVLIASDLSPASDCLVQCAAELKAVGLNEVVLAHVVYVANTPGLEHLLEAEAKPELQRQQKLLEGHGFSVEIVLQPGIPAHGLKDLAREHDVDGILIGSRGHGLTRSALGSVSFKLLQITSHPVFLSRINVQGEGDQRSMSVCLRPFEHILVPTDFSDTAERALDYVEKIVVACQPAVTLLHVADEQYTARLTPEGATEQKAIDLRRLETVKQRLEKLGSKVTIDWLIGSPGNAIVDRTRQGDLSLIVMGNQGKGFIQEALVGSVANEVARSTEVPILFVPAVQ